MLVFINKKKTIVSYNNYSALRFKLNKLFKKILNKNFYTVISQVRFIFLKVFM